MDNILTAVLAVGAIGIVCAVILILADKYFHVQTNEKEKEIRDVLPGANCGACGYTGCDGYAKALADGETDKTNLCVPGADAVSKQIAEITGLEAGDVVEQVANVKCLGDCDMTTDKALYEGIQTCAAAKMLFGSKGSCTYGCIGLGDCAAACPKGAICIENGIAHVNTKLCTGCGLCTKTCPQHIIHLMKDVDKVLVTCSNLEKGAATRQKCKHGCIACKKCEKNCPVGAVTIVNNIAEIDYSKCINCGECAKNCPVGCIMVSDFSGIHRYEVKE